jgi:hypothetical protein
MPCLTLTVALLLLALAVLVLHQYRRKRLTLRWWGAVLLAASALASFPLSLISTVYLLIQIHLMAPYELGLWITGGWLEYGRYACLAWVVGFPLVIQLKGVEFASRSATAWSIGVAMAVMLVLTAADAALLWDATQPGRRVETSAASPDGAQRATAIRWMLKDTCHYELVVEKNIAHPWLARSLVTVTLAPDDLAAGWSSAAAQTPPSGEDRVIWSRDSQVVIVMAAAEGGQVVAVYDFSQQQALTPAEREGGDNPTGRPGRWLQFVRTVMMLLREHGGEAP